METITTVVGEMINTTIKANKGDKIRLIQPKTNSDKYRLILL